MGEYVPSAEASELAIVTSRQALLSAAVEVLLESFAEPRADGLRIHEFEAREIANRIVQLAQKSVSPS